LETTILILHSVYKIKKYEKQSTTSRY
jgi:hypothetical protein